MSTTDLRWVTLFKGPNYEDQGKSLAGERIDPGIGVWANRSGGRWRRN